MKTWGTNSENINKVIYTYLAQKIKLELKMWGGGVHPGDSLGCAFCWNSGVQICSMKKRGGNRNHELVNVSSSVFLLNLELLYPVKSQLVNNNFYCTISLREKINPLKILGIYHEWSSVYIK